MNISTIGFTKKSAERFFNILNDNAVELLIDVRLNNSSQLSGFSKGDDLKYFLNKICNIQYINDKLLAPTKDILDAYKKKKISWCKYESMYISLLKERNIEKYFFSEYIKFNNICFLCSEDVPDYCHRRLLVDFLNNYRHNLNIRHL